MNLNAFKSIYESLEESEIVNDISFPYWMYGVVTIDDDEKRFAKVFLFDREFAYRKLNKIAFRHDKKKYKVDKFTEVAKFHNQNVYSCTFEIPKEDTLDDLKIAEETIDGVLIKQSKKLVVYKRRELPDENEYIKEKIPEYRDCFMVYPTIDKKHWQCSCGRFHELETEECQCKITKDIIKNVLEFDFQENHIQDYLSKPIDFDFTKTAEENIEIYKKNFTEKYGLDAKKITSRMDLEAEKVRYQECLENSEKRKIRNQKIKKISTIVIGSIAGIALLSFMIFGIFIPSIKYNKADKYLANGEYDKAIEIFDGLRQKNFSDSSDRYYDAAYLKYNNYLEKQEYKEAYDYILNYPEKDGFIDYQSNLSNCVLLYGEQLIKDNKHLEAIELLKTIPNTYVDYPKIASNLNTYQYVYADYLYENKNYQDAYAQIANCIISKSDELYPKIVYALANDYYKEEKYTEAVSLYEKIPTYEKASARMKSAMYKYVLAHKDGDDDTTYEYLRILKKKKYKDSAYLYSKLFEWKIKLVVNNGVKNINPGDPIEIVFTVKGGMPQGALKIKVVMTDSFGSTNLTQYFEMRKGETRTINITASEYLLGNITIKIVNAKKEVLAKKVLTYRPW